MAHFAEIDSNGIVLRVLVVPDSEESRGNDFLSTDLKLGGTWIQCSYNARIRKCMPGPGYTYDSTNDVFISPKPFASWTLDSNFDWQPPTPYPEELGGLAFWYEDSKSWKTD